MEKEPKLTICQAITSGSVQTGPLLLVEAHTVQGSCAVSGSNQEFTNKMYRFLNEVLARFAL